MSIPTGVAIGVGCRKGCPAQTVAALVNEALARTGRGGAALFTIADKRTEPGLAEAALQLGLPLVFLPREKLEAAAKRCQTHSAAVEARFGLPSIAEAAALAGAGPDSRLIVARLSAGGATCAVAAPREAGLP